jgi:hypothetical protein
MPFFIFFLGGSRKVMKYSQLDAGGCASLTCLTSLFLFVIYILGMDLLSVSPPLLRSTSADMRVLPALTTLNCSFLREELQGVLRLPSASIADSLSVLFCTFGSFFNDLST